jgi:hypothetical protein
MSYAYLEGVIQVANVFLAVVAGGIALSLFNCTKKKEWMAWKPLIVVLVLFVFEEIFGALRSFNIFSTPYLTHIIPSFILAFLIYALILQIFVAEGYRK